METFTPYSWEKKIDAIIDAVKISPKKDIYLKYISETLNKCRELSEVDECKRALNELKWMIHNLRQELNL
ncbi:MAG: hypothetical protein K2N30_00550 [Clostridia bacterium]|nr:hypothetical protein [Clostridia bacterium]